MRWASLKSDFSRLYMARRLETIHAFAKYIIAFDPNAQIPQLGVFGKAHGRTSPYRYSDDEISLLMAEEPVFSGRHKGPYGVNGSRAYARNRIAGFATRLRLIQSFIKASKRFDKRLYKNLKLKLFEGVWGNFFPKKFPQGLLGCRRRASPVGGCPFCFKA